MACWAPLGGGGGTIGVPVVVSGTLAPSSGTGVSTLAISNALTLNNGAALNFNFNGLTNDVVNATGSLTLTSGTTWLNINSVGTGLVTNNYKLIGYNGTLLGGGVVQVGSTPFPDLIYKILGPGDAGYSATQVTLGVSVPSVTWTGNASNLWNGTDLNWTGDRTTFADGNQVTFPDVATTSDVSIPSTVSPRSVSFTNTSGGTSYTISGAGIANYLTASTTLLVSGGGAVTLNNVSTYTGRDER